MALENPLLRPLLRRGPNVDIQRAWADAGGSSSFTAAPFVMADHTLEYTGSAHINLQLIFSGSTSVLSSQNGIQTTVPQQYGENYPSGFSVGYYLEYYEDLGPGEGLDAVDSVWPLLGVKQDASSTYSVGMTRPASGTKHVKFKMRGYDTDMTTVLAEATYQIIYNRT